MIGFKVGDRVEYIGQDTKRWIGEKATVIQSYVGKVKWDRESLGTDYPLTKNLRLIDMTIDELERQLKDLKDQAAALESKIESAKNARKFEGNKVYLVEGVTSGRAYASFPTFGVVHVFWKNGCLDTYSQTDFFEKFKKVREIQASELCFT